MEGKRVDTMSNVVQEYLRRLEIDENMALAYMGSLSDDDRDKIIIYVLNLAVKAEEYLEKNRQSNY